MAASEVGSRAHTAHPPPALTQSRSESGELWNARHVRSQYEKEVCVKVSACVLCACV